MLKCILILLMASSFASAACIDDPNDDCDIPNINLTWDEANLREDGSALLPDEIDHYVIYSNGETIEVEGTSHTLVDVDPGTHMFWISTVDSDLLEGDKSDPISVTVTEKPKSKITAISTLSATGECSAKCAYEVR